MYLQLTDKILLVSIVLICICMLGCNVSNNESKDDILVDYFYIKFTDYIIEMNSPYDTLGVESFSENSSHLETYFSKVDNKMSITRYRPDFHPSDTLRITAAGDTISRNNWALVYKFDLSKQVPFEGIEERAEKEPLIEWVDPPLFLRFLD